MCEPVTAISLVVGLGSMVSGTMQAVGAHQQQQAAVARSNAIAQQQYQQELQIAAAQDQEKGRTYKAQLESTAAAKNAYYRQISANQTEANRALSAESQRLQEQRRTAAFQAQKNVAEAIQAQGTVLASGKAGQSFLLQALDSERQLGFEQAQIDATLMDATRASGLAREGILLDQSSANIAAWNNLPADPLSPQASFAPIKPTPQGGPSSLALAGGIVGSVAGGVSSGFSTAAGLKDSNIFG